MASSFTRPAAALASRRRHHTADGRSPRTQSTPDAATSYRMSTDPDFPTAARYLADISSERHDHCDSAAENKTSQTARRHLAAYARTSSRRDALDSSE
ncbi:unnamed protein product, partial [Iphiclides podalirius]